MSTAVSPRPRRFAALVLALPLFACGTPAPEPPPDVPDAGSTKPPPPTGVACTPTSLGDRFAICDPTLTLDGAASGPEFQLNATIGESSAGGRVAGRRFAIIGSLSHE